MKKGKHFKRLWSLMLLLIAMLMPQGAWAISGSGTSSSPYLIANEADLRTFQQYVENGNSGIYGMLTADITLTSAWTRIGRADRRFTGYFDGQGHTISGMNLSFTANEHGFFGFVNDATIKNFTLTGTMTSSANGNHSHGTVVGSAAGTTVIENVTSSVNLTLNHTGFTCIGGIVGHMDESSKVIGCTYTGTINLNKDSEQVGGIVGYAQRNLYITDNVFSGTITSTGTCKYLAGIAGKTDGTIEVSGCTNIGTINGGPSYDCVAGIVGYVQNQSRALITNCYFGGSLSSTSSGTSLGMGGILGAVNDEAGTYFRGLTYCFSDGTLTATNSSSTQIGGIAGVIKSNAVSKVMNNTYLSGTASRLAAISNSSSTFDSSNKAITISVTAGTGGTVKKSYVYPTSTTATQLQVVATPNSGYHYVEWSDNGAQTHNVSLANNVSLTATFGAHTYGDWITDVAATCTSAGTHHRVCTYAGCGAREDGTIAALGHIYSPGSWSWAGDGHSATCTRTCSRDANHKSSASVTLGNGIASAQQVAPNCTTKGTTRYTATATVEGTQYSATKDVEDIAALGHGSTGYTPTYTWGGTYDDATCTFTLQCGSCGVEVFNDNITTSKVDANHVDVTCGKDGNERWTATGSYSKAGDATYNGEAQVKDYAIPATGLHAFDDVTDPHHTLCTVCKHSFFRYTATEKVEPYRPTKLKNAEGQGIYDKEKHTFDGKNGVMEFDKPLVTIGEKAFFQRYQFKGDLIIPNTVTTIENYGFNGCEGYTGNLIIPSSVTTIGEYAFCFCNFTGNLTIPNNINLGKSAFANCKGFNGTLTVSTPNIGERAFGDCSGFTELILSNSVETIGENAFQGCSSFSGNLNIPGSVTSIGYGAFSGCAGLTGNLTIPSSVTSIEWEAFRGCSGFTGIEMNSVPQIGTDAFNSVNCTKAVVLSDDSYVYTGENPYFPEVQSATYTRRGIKNQFGTLVLPFDVNGMGADYDLYKLDQVLDYELVLRKVDEDDNGGIVPAGTPVVFRLHDGLAGNHTLTLTASNTTVSGQLEERSEDNDFQLVGTYETIELYDYDYFISNNMFFYANDAMAWGVKVAPFRAYLSHNPWSSAKAQTLSIRIADEDDDVTAVETLNAITDGTAEYYDMNGRRINSLQKGVNIVKYGNGKTLKVNIK